MKITSYKRLYRAMSKVKHHEDSNHVMFSRVMRINNRCFRWDAKKLFFKLDSISKGYYKCIIL